MEHRPHNFATAITPTWCPGCGNFALWTALNHVLARRQIAPHEAVVVFDIGCASNAANWVKAYTFHGLHGRSLPLGVGVALANHGLQTIVVSGDGAAYSEGLSHLFHTIRANPNITYIVEDNQLYALTKGQASPTSSAGARTTSTPDGVIDQPLNPLALAITADASFVGRGFAGNLPHLETLIDQAISHRGFSFIDVFQPCVSFNHLNTYAWFYERVKPLEQLQHDPHDRLAAWQLAQQVDPFIPIGRFYQNDRPVLSDLIAPLKSGPLADQPVAAPDLTDLLNTLV